MMLPRHLSGGTAETLAATLSETNGAAYGQGY